MKFVKPVGALLLLMAALAAAYLWWADRQSARMARHAGTYEWAATDIPSLDLTADAGDGPGVRVQLCADGSVAIDLLGEGWDGMLRRSGNAFGGRSLRGRWDEDFDGDYVLEVRTPVGADDWSGDFAIPMSFPSASTMELDFAESLSLKEWVTRLTFTRMAAHEP